MQVDVDGILVDAVTSCDPPYGSGGEGGYDPVTRMYSVQLCFLGAFSLYYQVPPEVSIATPKVVHLVDGDVRIVADGVGTDPDGFSEVTYEWTVATPRGPVQLCPGQDLTMAHLELCDLVNGSYALTLTVTDANGGVGSKTVLVTANVPPTAALSIDTSGTGPILLSANQSTDVEDALPDLVFAWRYFLAPDAAYVPLPSDFVRMGTEGTPRVPVPKMFRPGVFSVEVPALGTHWFQVTVRDTEGATATATASTTSTLTVFAGQNVVVSGNFSMVVLNGSAISTGVDTLSVGPVARFVCFAENFVRISLTFVCTVACIVCACSWYVTNANTSGLTWEPVASFTSDSASWSAIAITHIPTEIRQSWDFVYQVFVNNDSYVSSGVKVVVNRPPVPLVVGASPVTLPLDTIVLSAAGDVGDEGDDISLASWEGIFPGSGTLRTFDQLHRHTDTPTRTP